MPRTLFLSLLALTLFLGCTKKKKDTSPYVSSEYFTCLVNGQEWVAQSPGGPNNPAAVHAEYYAPTQQITITATMLVGNKFQKVWVFCAGLTEPGTYPMTYTSSQTYGFYDHYSESCGVYYYNENYISDITVTEFNEQNHHIAGSFQMTLHNPDCTDSIMTINNGQFSTSFQ